MTIVTFEPKGEVAEWKMVHDHLARLKVGDVVTYEQLSVVLDRDFLDNRGPFLKANFELLRTHKRGLTNIRNVGYRVVSAQEHEDAARSQHRSARRRLRRSASWLAGADRKHLSADQARRIDALEEHVARQIDFTRRLDARVAKVEKTLEEARPVETAAAAEDLAERFAKLEEALLRQGIVLT